jgi:hypothetical protein
MRVIQLRFFGNSSYWHICSKCTQNTANGGIISLADSWCLSVSTIAGLGQIKSWSANLTPPSGLSSKSLKRWPLFSRPLLCGPSHAVGFLLSMKSTKTMKFKGSVGTFYISRKMVWLRMQTVKQILNLTSFFNPKIHLIVSMHILRCRGINNEDIRRLLVDHFHTSIRLLSTGTESIATLPPFGPIEGQKWFDRISSQWEFQKNRFSLI